MSNIEVGDRVIISADIIEEFSHLPKGIYRVLKTKTTLKNVYLISSEEVDFKCGISKESVIPFIPLKELYSEIF